MKELDTRALGKILRELRGSSSQTEIAEHTGIPQYTLSDLELGKVEKPSFDYILRLSTYYGLTPNHLAAAIGLIPAPGQDWDADELIPMLAQTIYIIRTFGLQLDEHEQRDFSIRLEAAIDAQRRAWENRQRASDGQSSMGLPGWLAEAVRRP